jgi:hypothetical protein
VSGALCIFQGRSGEECFAVGAVAIRRGGKSDPSTPQPSGAFISDQRRIGDSSQAGTRIAMWIFSSLCRDPVSIASNITRPSTPGRPRSACTLTTYVVDWLQAHIVRRKERVSLRTCCSIDSCCKGNEEKLRGPMKRDTLCQVTVCRTADEHPLYTIARHT